VCQDSPVLKEGAAHLVLVAPMDSEALQVIRAGKAPWASKVCREFKAALEQLDHWDRTV